MQLNKYDLKKKFCLITGAAGMLGYEHARTILEINGNVVLTDIDEKDNLNAKKIKKII